MLITNKNNTKVFEGKNCEGNALNINANIFCEIRFGVITFNFIGKTN